MAPLNRLDVTQIEPRLKHPTIFQYFDALDLGESFVIDNDHDPKPLYYELLGERGDIFTWEYLEQGPEWWRVRIAKREKRQDGSETIGEIAARDLRKAQILKEKGIDFSCGQHKTVKEAAKEASISEQDLQQALEDTTTDPVFPPSHNYREWTVGFLMEYLVHSHHEYTRTNASQLADLVLKVAGKHGDQYPELKKLAYAAQLFFNDLNAHLDKEERFLFPAIHAMCTNGPGESDQEGEEFESAIRMLEKEHLITVEDLNYFRKISNDYTLPEDACSSWSYLYERLKEFEEDWKHHIHIENNILFPRVLELLKGQGIG